MTSKEALDYMYIVAICGSEDFKTTDKIMEGYNKIADDLEILEAIKKKAQNNRFFRGCLLRMFVETKKTPYGAFMKKEKIKDEDYEKIVRWLDA